jgi:UDP-N-acetylglucosamine 2-epimerase (non-hydrolysing)
MKMAPVILELQRRGLRQIVVHTGQHHDAQMSDVFFEGLGLPQPDFQLAVGSGTHAEQTARTMMGFEPVCRDARPGLVVVAGDVNSTLACALTAAKLCIPVAHVESGLRSFDRSMPEEINRVLTDHLATLLFTTENSGNENLMREGITADRIHFVGNSMIDSLRSHIDDALRRLPWLRFGFEPARYGLVTLHRPSNVDNMVALAEIIAAINEISRELPLLFAVHPRTRQRMEEFGIDPGRVTVTQPLGYTEFLGLMANAAIVLTDSGGIQEETTALGVPCVTVRPNTERPITLELGMNRLADLNRVSIVSAVREARFQSSMKTGLPPLWDGNAAKRIADILQRWLTEQDEIHHKVLQD